MDLICATDSDLSSLQYSIRTWFFFLSVPSSLFHHPPSTKDQTPNLGSSIVMDAMISRVLANLRLPLRLGQRREDVSSSSFVFGSRVISSSPISPGLRRGFGHRSLSSTTSMMMIPCMRKFCVIWPHTGGLVDGLLIINRVANSLQYLRTPNSRRQFHISFIG